MSIDTSFNYDYFQFIIKLLRNYCDTIEDYINYFNTLLVFIKRTINKATTTNKYCCPRHNNNDTRTIETEIKIFFYTN